MSMERYSLKTYQHQLEEKFVKVTKKESSSGGKSACASVSVCACVYQLEPAVSADGLYAGYEREKSRRLCVLV